MLSPLGAQRVLQREDEELRDADHAAPHAQSQESANVGWNMPLRKLSFFSKMFPEQALTHKR